MTCWLRTGLVVVLLWLAHAPPAQGEEAGSSAADLMAAANLSGSLRGAYWSSNRTLDDREHFLVAGFWLRSAPKLDSNVSAVIDGWVGNQDLFHAEATTGELREAYLDFRFGSLDLRTGKQIILWGRADRINPTDNLTPRDFTLLVPQDTDQRSGATGVQTTYHLGSVSLIGVFLATFEPHQVQIPPPPPGSTLRDRSSDDPVTQWAAKIDQTGGRFDWSISYFDGFDPFPDLGLDRIRPNGVDVVLRNHRIRVVGADAATTLGPYGLRGEAAYTFTKDRSGDDLETKNPFFFMVLGGDRTFFDNLNVNVQYIFRKVTNFQEPRNVTNPLRRSIAREQNLLTNQVDAAQHLMSLRINKRWLNDTLEAELGSVLSFTRFDYVLRPKINYAITDTLKVTVGADVFQGEEQSFFGRRRDNTTVYAEVRRSF